MSDEELDEIRRKMRKKLVENGTGEKEEKAFLGQNFEPEARQRLGNLKLIKPELAEQVEQHLTELIRSGRVNPPITDSQMKQLLLILQSEKRDQKVQYK